MIVFGGFSHKRIKPFAFFASYSFVVAAFEFGDFHFHFVGKDFYRVDKIHAFHFFDKRNRVAAFLAAETMVKLLVLVYGERGFLFMVKRTAPPIGPALLFQR